MSYNKRIDGATSLGLPGVQGIKGIRSRVFFYGNSAVQDTTHRKIYFGTTQSDVDSRTKYAIIADVFEPEEYDYIMYTTTWYDYLLIIRSVQAYGEDYKCIVQKIDTLDLTASSNDVGDSVELSFNINKKKRQITISKRDALNYHVEHVEGGFLWWSYDNITAFPITYQDTTTSELVDITLSVPSNSTYVFDSNIKIVVEFYTNQSFIMDSMIADKYDKTDDLNNTYRGNHDLYSLIKRNPSDPSTWIQEDVNFDDERIENFTYILKDFNDERNGSKNITASFPLMLTSLKRPHNNAEAYLFAYIKDGRFVDKYLIDKFDLSFIDSDDDSTTTYDHEWNDRGGDSSVDPDLPDNPVIPIIPDIPDLTWTCNCCGTTGNTRLYCSGCGKREGQCLDPADHGDDTWQCRCCGKTGNTGEYCSNCGKERYACPGGVTPSGGGGGGSDIIDIEVDDPLNPDFDNDGNHHMHQYEVAIR